MGRNFNNDNTKYIDLGDITTARFKLADTWSIIAFFRIEELTVDERCIVSKWGSGADTRQFEIRVSKAGDPSAVQVFGTTGLTAGNNISLDNWYLVCCTNDGTGDAGGVSLFVVDMIGTFLDDLTGTKNADKSDLTSPIRYSTTAIPNDEQDGDIAHVCYVDAAVAKSEVSEYLRNPTKTVARWVGQHGVQFYHPLGLGSPEPDHSGSGNAGTVTGSPTVGDNPPTGVLGADMGWQGAFAVAAGDQTVAPNPVAMTMSTNAPSIAGSSTATAITPSPVSMVMSVIASVVAGSGTATAITPDTTSMVMSVVTPVIAGSGTATAIIPSATAMVMSVNSPTVAGSGSATAITPSSVAMVMSVVTPTLAGSGVATAITPGATAMVMSVVAPAITTVTGDQTVTPSPVAMVMSVNSPTLAGSGTATPITPAALVMVMTVISPVLSAGGAITIVLTLNSSQAEALIVDSTQTPTLTLDSSQDESLSVEATP